MIKVEISKAFITKGMEDENGKKFQSISVMTGKTPSYLSIHIEETTRKKIAPLLIKGQQITNVKGNLSILQNKYKGVFQKTPVIWIDEIKLEFTQEQIKERAVLLAAGKKPEQPQAEKTAKVDAPGIEPQQEVVEPEVGTIVVAPEPTPEVVEEITNVVVDAPLVDITEHIEVEGNVEEVETEESTDEELTDAEVLAMLG